MAQLFTFLFCLFIVMLVVVSVVAKESLILSFVIAGCFFVFAALLLRWKSKKDEKEKEQATVEENRKLETTQKLLAEKFGLEKFHRLHSDDVSKFQAGVEAIRKLGVLTEASVVQEKEHNWAIHGGIAHGIAGPVAGVAAALNIMQENERIREENARRRAWGTQQRLQYEALAKKAEADKPQYLSMREIEQLYIPLFGESADALFEKLGLKIEHIDPIGNTGCVKVTVSWKCGINWVDGAIRAKLYGSDGKCVGCAYLPLPKFGTKEGSGKLTGVCAQVTRKSSTYTVRLEPIDLWQIISAEQAQYFEPEEIDQWRGDPKLHQKEMRCRQDAYLAELENESS